MTLPKKTQFKSVLLSGKIMAAVFWVEKGVSCELFPWGTLVNSLTVILNRLGVNVHAFIEFVQQEKCQKCIFSMKMPGCPKLWALLRPS